MVRVVGKEGALGAGDIKNKRIGPLPLRKNPPT